MGTPSPELLVRDVAGEDSVKPVKLAGFQVSRSVQNGKRACAYPKVWKATREPWRVWVRMEAIAQSVRSSGQVGAGKLLKVFCFQGLLCR